jgi:hypothetical protein
VADNGPFRSISAPAGTLSRTLSGFLEVASSRDIAKGGGVEYHERYEPLTRRAIRKTAQQGRFPVPAGREQGSRMGLPRFQLSQIVIHEYRPLGKESIVNVLVVSFQNSSRGSVMQISVPVETDSPIKDTASHGRSS